jgi:hypothetical protein
MTQLEGSGESDRPAQPVFVKAEGRMWRVFDDAKPPKRNAHNVVIGDVIYEVIYPHMPAARRVAAFPTTREGHEVYGNPFQLAARLHEIQEEDAVKERVPPLTPEESRHALRRLVQQKFQEARDDELMESYAKRPDNNAAVQAKVYEWRARKEAQRLEREEARAEWQQSRDKEWPQG